jgi:hypothetical protein
MILRLLFGRRFGFFSSVKRDSRSDDFTLTFGPMPKNAEMKMNKRVCQNVSSLSFLLFLGCEQKLRRMVQNTHTRALYSSVCSLDFDSPGEKKV